MGLIQNIIKKATTITPLRPFPFTVNGANLRYAYDMEITPVSSRSVVAALGKEEKIVDVSIENGIISLSHGGTQFATINAPDKCKMVSDYIKRGDPVNAVLRANGTVNLRFYRDMRIGAKSSELVTLTGYNTKACQDVIESASVGDELGCYEDGNKIVVCEYFCQDNSLGKMPSKIVKRAEDEDIRAVYLEEVQKEIDDDYETKYIPIVRIYW